MAGILEFDQLCRIREATERTARRLGNMVPLSAYNNLVALYNDLYARHNAVVAERNRLRADLDQSRRETESVKDYSDKLDVWGRSTLDDLKLTETERNEARRERDLFRNERDKARSDLKALQERYDYLYVNGRANRDMWKERAEKAEKELAALKAASRPAAANVA